MSGELFHVSEESKGSKRLFVERAIVGMSGGLEEKGGNVKVFIAAVYVQRGYYSVVRENCITSQNCILR